MVTIDFAFWHTLQHFREVMFPFWHTLPHFREVIFSTLALGAFGEPKVIWGGFGEALGRVWEALGRVWAALGRVWGRKKMARPTDRPPDRLYIQTPDQPSSEATYYI